MLLPDPAEYEDATFARLFRTVMHDLRAALRQKLRNRHEAEDVAQEAFLRAWSARESEQIENPRSFLFRVANNIAIDRLRERQRWQWADETAIYEQSDGLSPERTVAAREELALMQGVLDRLSANCRQAFLLRLDGQSHAQIAAAMGVSKSMVEKHLAQALVRLDKARARAQRGRS